MNNSPIDPNVKKFSSLLLSTVDEWIDDAKRGNPEKMYFELMTATIEAAEEENPFIRKSLLSQTLAYLRIRAEYPEGTDELIIRYRLRDLIEKAINVGLSQLKEQEDAKNARQKSET